MMPLAPLSSSPALWAPPPSRVANNIAEDETSSLQAIIAGFLTPASLEVRGQSLTLQSHKKSYVALLFSSMGHLLPAVSGGNMFLPLLLLLHLQLLLLLLLLVLLLPQSVTAAAPGPTTPLGCRMVSAAVCMQWRPRPLLYRFLLLPWIFPYTIPAQGNSSESVHFLRFRIPWIHWIQSKP